MRKTPKKKVYVYQEMSHLGLFLWALGCARMHKDGDGFCSIFRPWHPVNWLLLLILMPVCAILGEKLLDAVPFRLSKFWQLNREQLQWVQPWTRLDSLKPFDHSRSIRPTLAGAFHA